MSDEVEALLQRSRSLGADRRITNHAGGNTSAKVAARDPVTGAAITLLWVKGSGGDLATLTRDGLAALVLERVLALPLVEESFVLLEHCRFGAGNAPPSIDTPLHALLPAAHIDHMHPDAVIALAAARDGETVVKECFGGTVGWVPWRRPGFVLARDLAATFHAHPGLRGIVLGGHGLFTWGQTADECEQTTRAVIAQAERYLAGRGRVDPFGPLVRRPVADRRAAAVLAPRLRGACAGDRWVIGHLRDDTEIIDFLARADARRLTDLGTSCPDHFLRTRVRPLWVDDTTRLHDLVAGYRHDYRSYYERHAEPDSPAMRGADPTVALVPGVGLWGFGADAAAARITAEYFVHAIHVMRGAQSVSAYEPIPEAEKFGIEYWPLEDAKLRRQPEPPALAGRVALVTGAGSGIGRAIAERLASDGAMVVCADVDGQRALRTAEDLGGPDRAVGVGADVSDETAVEEAFRTACLVFGGVDLVVNNAGLSIAGSLLDTTGDDWDRLHDVLARGSFLVSRAAALVMVEQGRGGDIVYVVSKNAVVAGPENVAYASAKADQAHQVRLLAAELGEHGIRVNGVNPDAVVRGSGIFSGGWGAQRAAAHGIREEDLPRFYAERTLLKREVLPEHVADAVFAIVGGDLTLTTGTLVPVDGGVPAAFLR